MPLISAGLLLYRLRAGQVEFFIVHPGGPFWKDRDAGTWSIPKGLADPGEDLLAAARREFQEETGTAIAAPDDAFIPLGEVKQKGGKRVIAWAVAGDIDADAIRSNTYAVQWPKGTWRRYPEVDRAGWFDAAGAREKLLAAQAEFVDRLLAALNAQAE